MFDVLAYVYENFYLGEPVPEPDHLASKLGAAGFEADEVSQALTWMHGLRAAANGLRAVISPPAMPCEQGWLAHPSGHSMRAYASFEQRHLGSRCLGFIAFLESSGDLPAPLRELLLERVMATAHTPLALEDLKLMVLMVYWSVDFEPSALILDELSAGTEERVLH